MKMHIRLRHIVFLGVALALAVIPAVVGATNSWGGYHWARSSNPFTLKLGDNLSSAWDPILATTSSDWSQSTVLDTTVVPGKAKGSCAVVTSGRVEVCNKAYGFNGWLGLAGIWVSDSHITAGYVKVNDSYFNTPEYNSTAWRNLVMCQEVGHTLGLDHQDENFYNDNLGTCMDYTSDPDSNQHPNLHDYDQLVAIYTHLDQATTPKSGKGNKGGGAGAGPASGQDGEEWGVAVRNDAHGRPNLFVRDLGGGQKKFTWVFWTAPSKP